MDQGQLWTSYSMTSAGGIRYESHIGAKRCQLQRGLSKAEA